MTDLTNREHGYLDRLRERRDILLARTKTPHRNHAVIEWERELHAVEWALSRLAGPLDGDRLRAVLEGLECREIDQLMTKSPALLKLVATSVAFAAKLGAHLVPSPATGERQS